jgi:hypothetical protein
MAGKDAGVEARCPGCGQMVLQKAMIPVLAEGGGVAYLCRDCARLHIQTAAEGTEAQADPDTEAAAADQPNEEPDAGNSDAAPAESTATKRRARRPDRPLRARAPRPADA